MADDEPRHLEPIRERLESVPGRDRASQAGTYPRYRVLPAHDGEEAIRLVSDEVSALVVDLLMPRRNGIEVIQEIRPRRADIAILSYTSAAPPAQAVAAMVAGADHFLEYADAAGIEYALDLAINRRRLLRRLQQSAAEAEDARRQLDRLGGNMSLGVSGLRPPISAEAVIPFNEAARRYLLACAKIFAGDARGLAGRLGISYFALRRLLKRYDVPFPGRPRRGAPRKR